MPHSAQMVLASNNSTRKVATRCHMIRSLAENKNGGGSDRHHESDENCNTFSEVAYREMGEEGEVQFNAQRMYELAAAESESHAVDVLRSPTLTVPT